MKNPKLTLVGAGPGDPDLISLKGVKALKSADVILYDALVHPDLLKYASHECECVFVGKRKGVLYLKQEAINDLIVEKAKEKGHVVRLKGGDSFVFGRGHEELLAAEENGIEIEIVPGISSCYAVPELQNIPITRRDFSQSFWVITATNKDHEMPQDIYDAAKSNATVIVLMGVHKLPQIVAVYQKEKKGKLPIALISNGSRDNEAIAVGTIDTIVDVVAVKELKPPAIIVIGDVVSVHRDFKKL